MSGGGFILAINLSVAALVAGAFLIIAAYDRKAVAPRWMTLSSSFGLVYVSLEFAVGLVPESPILVAGAYLSFAAGLACLDVALARNYDQPLPARWIAGLLVLALVTIVVHGGTPTMSLLPMLLYQLPYTLIQGVGAVIVLRSPGKRALDYVLVGILITSAGHFLLKPLIALAVGGMGDSAGAYMTTLYALFSQTVSAVFFIALAFAIIIIMMRDLLSAMTVKSETDPLTGVLNRRGFEERVEPLLRLYQGSRVPLALILCDLDHFKGVNDTYGHATGDLVIAAFARQLSLASHAGQIVGRVGGEEFAVVYPGGNMPMARIFAEGLRSSFAALSIPGAPPGRTFTASFGVAELQKEETISTLMARADQALYLAKTAGRDCVRIAPAVIEANPQPASRPAQRSHLQ